MSVPLYVTFLFLVFSFSLSVLSMFMHLSCLPLWMFFFSFFYQLSLWVCLIVSLCNMYCILLTIDYYCYYLYIRFNSILSCDVGTFYSFSTKIFHTKKILFKRPNFAQKVSAFRSCKSNQTDIIEIQIMRHVMPSQLQLDV